MRKPQISWPVTAPQLLPDFVFNFGLLGPHHHPLIWTIPKWYPGPRPKPIVLFDRHRIRQEMKQNTSRWQGFCWEARQLLHSHIARDSSLFLQLENNLTELCKTWFPKQTSMPVACNPLASITAQMWQARKVVRALTDRLPATLFTAWKHLTMFRRCHKQIRHFSRQNKRQKLEDFLQEGADLAMRHQTYDWFRKVRKLCPKQRPQKIQIFDDQGQPLTPSLELKRIENFFGQLFQDHSFQYPGNVSLRTLPFTSEDVLQGLHHLPEMKALAPPCMPAIIWRHLAPELAKPIHDALEHYWCAEIVAPPSHWLDGWLHLIPKPGKPSTQPAALRPLCLQHPVLKIISKILITLIKQQAYPTLRSLPLYAYLPQRGTTECLLRVSQHCQQIRQLCRDRQQDASPQGLFGGLQVSLDMEKAFDTVRRDLVLHALDQINLSSDVLHMIQTWLVPHKYHIPFKSLIGIIDASRGIKQGSTDAPILWTLCMFLIMKELLQRYSHEWLHDHLIVYADDVHIRWTLHSIADGLDALGDLAHILHTFRSFGFNINPTKSVVLFRAVGKGVSKFTRQ